MRRLLAGVLLALAVAPCHAGLSARAPTGWSTPHFHVFNGTSWLHFAAPEVGSAGVYRTANSVIDDSLVADCRAVAGFESGFPTTFNDSATDQTLPGADGLLRSGSLPWDGTTEILPASQTSITALPSASSITTAVWGAARSSFTASGTMGQFANWAFATMSASGVFTEPALAAGAAGEASIDEEAINDLVERMIAAKAFKPNPQLVWVLRRSDKGVGSQLARRKRAGETVTFYADAGPLLADGEAIVPESIAIATEEGSELAIDEESIDVLNSQITFSCADGDAGDEDLTIAFTTSLGQEIEATVPLTID